MSAPAIPSTPPGRGFLVILGMLSAGAAALVIASLLTSKWYELYLDGSLNSIGIFEACSDNGHCGSINFHDLAISSTTCTRKSGDISDRFIVLKVLSIAGGAMGLLSALFTLAAIQRGASVRPIRFSTLLTVLGFVCLAVVIIVFVYTFENWLYCDTTPCEYLRTVPGVSKCTGQYGYSFMLLCIACGCHTLVMMLEISYLLMRGNDAVASTTEPTATHETDMAVTAVTVPVTVNPSSAAPSPARTSEAAAPRPAAPASTATNPIVTPPTTNPMVNGDTKPPAGVPPPPAGDWVYDNESGLYWSDSHFLFLHPQTNQYYDPKSDMWYDPDNDKWYSANK